MLWVLKRTVSMRRFFRAPKAYVKTDGQENIYNFTLKSFVYLNLCDGHAIIRTIEEETEKRNQRLCLVWIFTSQAAIFQSCRDGSSWVELVLSRGSSVLFKDTTQCLRWPTTPPSWVERSTTEPTRSSETIGENVWSWNLVSLYHVEEKTWIRVI